MSRMGLSGACADSISENIAYSSNDVAGSEICAIGNRLAFLRGDDIHWIKILVSGGEITIGCTKMSVAAWRLLVERVEEAL